MKTKIIAFVWIYLFAIAVFTAHFVIVGKSVYGDGRYYYAYLPSILLNHSLNFSESLNQIGAPFFLTPLKYAANIYSIGPALFWIEPFLFAHVLLLPFSVADGYNGVYQFFIGVWDISLMSVGLYFLYESLAKFFPEKVALTTTGIIFFSSNLLFYGAVDVVNSHSLSFFLSSLFLFLWLNEWNRMRSFLMGIILGLSMLVRLQDALLIILPVSTLLAKRLHNIILFIVLCVTAGIIISPQIILWRIEWGTWFQSPYFKVQKFYFLTPHIFGVLFNRADGLFLWTPIYLMGFIGLLLFTYKNRRLGFPMVIFFILQLYIISTWAVWWEGSSYSGRMFISSLPLLAFGLAETLSISRYQVLIHRLCYLFCIVNPVLIIIFLKFVK